MLIALLIIFLPSLNFFTSGITKSVYQLQFSYIFYGLLLIINFFQKNYIRFIFFNFLNFIKTIYGINTGLFCCLQV